MAFYIRIDGAVELKAYLDRVTTEFIPAMDTLTMAVADTANASARNNIAPTKYSTGALASSIKSYGPDSTGTGNVEAMVSSQGVVYAHIQEVGGVVEANGNAGGDGVWLKFVIPGVGFRMAHSVTIPPKHYFERGAARAFGELPGIADEILGKVFA